MFQEFWDSVPESKILLNAQNVQDVICSFDRRIFCILFLIFFFLRIYLVLNFRENDIVIRAWQGLLMNA